MWQRCQVLSDSIEPQSGASEGDPGHSVGARRSAAATSGGLRPTSSGSRLGRAGPTRRSPRAGRQVLTRCEAARPGMEHGRHGCPGGSDSRPNRRTCSPVTGQPASESYRLGRSTGIRAGWSFEPFAFSQRPEFELDIHLPRNHNREDNPLYPNE